ncbi:hypothetical protein MMC12_005422 [Toensbergia leucococca]|nr:hypothetical protein [Toensbergia leucococca]
MFSSSSSKLLLQRDLGTSSSLLGVEASLPTMYPSSPRFLHCSFSYHRAHWLLTRASKRLGSNRKNVFQLLNDYWVDHDESDEYPRDCHAALARDNWIGIALPEDLNGAGLSISEATLMLHTISQSRAGMAGAQSIHANVYATQPVARFATQHQKKRRYYGSLAANGRHALVQQNRGQNVLYESPSAMTQAFVGSTDLDTLKLRTQAIHDEDY